MEELKLTFVNVGYGEAALLECPDPAFPGGTFVMVIDGGSAEAEEYRDSATGRIPLDQYLSLRGVDHIDLMAATHVHEDHLCGLLPAAEKLPPAALWQTLPPEFCRSMLAFSSASGLATASSVTGTSLFWRYWSISMAWSRSSWAWTLYQLAKPARPCST